MLMATHSGWAAQEAGVAASQESGVGEDEKPKESFWDRYKDPEDGKFDVTASGEGTSGFLPLLIPFNEPAIGIGVIGAIAYFHRGEEPAAAPREPARFEPPSTTFGGGVYSENGTWAIAGGHSGVWRDGRIRYLGAVGYASANLDFYGIGNEPDLNEDPIPFNSKGGGIVQQAQVRLGRSRVFVGGKYTFAAVDTTFDTRAQDLDGEGETTNASLTALVNYDSRDNIFTPNRGTHATFELSYFSESLGGDFDYGSLGLAGYQYWPIHERLIFGLRLEYDQAGDGGPFYALPWVKLRGVPAFRYLGNYVVTGEIEPRWKIDGRWSVLAFGGMGRAARELDELSDAERAFGYGVGFRYLLARKLGMGAGLDVAQGPEETTVYIIFGSAWGF